MQHKVGNIVDEVKYGLIIHQVNCQGVMASGVAKDIRAKWPVVFEAYMDHINSGVCPEDVHGTVNVVRVDKDLYVANVFSQLNYGRDGKRYTSYDAIDTALTCLKAWMFENDCTSLETHHPLLGSGLGGAHWPVVAAIIQHRIGPNTTLWTLPQA